MKSAIVLILDGLGSGWLGPYGNSWIETPAMNHLAAQSQVVEFVVSDSQSPDEILRSMLSGTHVACRGASDFPHRTLPGVLPTSFRSVLLTDQEEFVRPGALGDDFQQAVVCSGVSGHLASCEEETGFARLFGELAALMERLPTPYLICVYAQGLFGPWDAPYSLRASLADPEDPAPPELVDPPLGPVGHDVDPDQLLGLRCAAGGQILLADACLHILLNQLDHLPLAEQPLLIMTSARGFPLGEHGMVGAEGSGLFAELVNVPLMVRLPAGHAEAARHRLLAQPQLVAECLRGWLEVEGTWPSCSPAPDWTSTVPLPTLPLAASVGPGQWRLQTEHWCSRLSRLHERSSVDLFVKPDDRWEANDVAGLCPEVAFAFRQLAEDCRQGMLHEFHHGGTSLPAPIDHPAG